MSSNVKVIPTCSRGLLSGKTDHHDHVVPGGKMELGPLVCVCVCVCVCIHVYVHTSVCVCTVCECVYVCLCVCKSVFTCIRMSVCLCVYVCVSVGCQGLCICVCAGFGGGVLVGWGWVCGVTGGGGAVGCNPFFSNTFHLCHPPSDCK